MTPRQRKAAGRRGGAARTPAKRAASRSNGAKGGRPPKDRHFEDFEDLGKPPEHPLMLAAWFARVIGRDTWRQINGRGDDKISGHIRASASALSKVMPMDVVAEALKILEQERGKLQQDKGPDTVPAEQLDGPRKSVGI